MLSSFVFHAFSGSVSLCLSFSQALYHPQKLLNLQACIHLSSPKVIYCYHPGFINVPNTSWGKGQRSGDSDSCPKPVLSSCEIVNKCLYFTDSNRGLDEPCPQKKFQPLCLVIDKIHLEQGSVQIFNTVLGISGKDLSLQHSLWPGRESHLNTRPRTKVPGVSGHGSSFL